MPKGQYILHIFDLIFFIKNQKKNQLINYEDLNLNFHITFKKLNRETIDRTTCDTFNIPDRILFSTY